MIRKILFTLLLVLPITTDATYAHPEGKDPRRLVETMVEAIGGRARFYALKDVEYEYTYDDVAKKQRDVSLERYIFHGELSWARYTEHTRSVMPEKSGTVVQGYNGKVSWTTLNGQLVDDPKEIRIADFLRKTNYYWFAMMFKLLDPGISYEYEGIRNVEGVPYDIVKVTFGANVGDAQDIYVLYINPKTHLVDQFLFTVMDFNRSEPLLMKVEYESVNGLLLPTKRKYAPASWAGETPDDSWILELSRNVRFNNGFTPSMFEPPTR